ncbi:MAG: cytochrome b/b6 domain-containing protein [Gammaproteobacteria bacterium]
MQSDETEHRPVPVWDLPTRLFHWLLVAAVATSWLSVELGAMEVHRWSGYAILSLVVFRLLWGVFGSPHARFGDFVRGPGAVWRYLRGHDVDYGGHNPLGGWAVLALLALLLVQAVSGLFATDEILFEGPYYPAVAAETAAWLTGVHKQNFDLLLALVALHVAAVLFHRLARGHDLLRPMLTGLDPERPGRARPRPWWLALTAAAIATGAVAGLLALAPPPVSYF